MSKGYEYMRQVVVRSVGVGGVVDDNGRSLRVIGNMPIKPGDTVWTDGRIVYGHRPIRPSVKPPILFAAGVPFAYYDNQGGAVQGYYDDRAVKKTKLLGQVSEGGLLVNDERQLWLERNPGRKILDAEVLTDDEGVPIGYSIATARAGADISNVQQGSVRISNSLGTYTKTIDMEDDSLVELVVEDFAKMVGAQQYEYDEEDYVIQFLHFLFTNDKGDWEMDIGVTVKDVIFYIEGGAGEPRPKFTLTTTLKREIVSRDPFIGGADIATCYETITYSSQQTGEEPTGDNDNIRDPAQRCFAVVRLDSAGRVSIVSRNYEKKEHKCYQTVNWHVIEADTYDAEAFPWSGPVNAQPEGVQSVQEDAYASREGSYSYSVKYFGPSTDEDIVGWAQVGLPGTRVGSYTISTYGADTEIKTIPAIRENDDLTYNLPDGFTAVIQADTQEENTYKQTGVSKQGINVLSGYTESRGKHHKSYGLIDYDDPAHLWVFPKLSCYQFPRLGKALVSHYDKKFMLCVNGGYSTEGTRPLNLRLRRMHKVTKSS